MRLLLHLSRGSLFLHTSGRVSSPKRRKNSASPISNILGGSTPAFEMNGSKLGKFSSSKDMQRNVAFVSFFFVRRKQKKKKRKVVNADVASSAIGTYTHTHMVQYSEPRPHSSLLRDGPDAAFLFTRTAQGHDSRYALVISASSFRAPLSNNKRAKFFPSTGF